MMKKVKKLICLLGMAVTLAGSVCVYAEGSTENVYDDAYLLSASEAETLSQEISELKQETGWEIFAVSTDDAEGKSARAYADDFYDAHTAEDSDGVALLIDMDNREIYISTYGEAVRYLDDNRLDAILDDAYYYVADAEYMECFEAMLDGVADYYRRGIPEGQYNYDTETGAISKHYGITLTEILPVLLVAVIVGLVIFFSVVGKYRLKFGTYKYDFHRYGKLRLSNREDQFINQTLTQRRIQTQSSGSSSGSRSSSSHRSSTHRSSSGRSHGGRGRKF